MYAGQIKYLISQLHSFVTLGLDLLNTAIKRNRFESRDSSIIAKLEAIVAVVGNTLYSKDAPVLTLGMRCIAGLSKCPLRAMENSIPVVVRQILDTIKQIGSTESDVAQVALKSLATILRDGPPVQVKEKDLVYLLELISPDLEEPSRQATIFTLLRAIVARKFVVPEIYDLMESVSKASVTSQSIQVQELCRGVLLQFLLDYPQGKGRLRNQMSFFAKNLTYIHESGRTSIMELLSAVILKFEEALIVEYAELLFVALVMVVANDESAKCREMAAQLIKNLWTRLEAERRKVILSHLHTWASQTTQILLAWVAMQVYGFLVDVSQAESSSYVSSILDDLKVSLQRSSMTFKAMHENQNSLATEGEPSWQPPYHSLSVLAKILNVFPDFAVQDDKIEWNYVTEHLIFPHAWVRTAAGRLLHMLFNVVPAAFPRTDRQDDHPLSMIGMRDVARKLTQQLKSEHLDATQNLQIMKNLFYVGKCFDCIPLGNSTTGTKDLLDQDEDGEPGITKEEISILDNSLPWLFRTLSYQIRSMYIVRRN
jgi:U3 small nucleolar RNA-associated protein 20